MHHVKLRKPDGRTLALYARSPISEGLSAPSPQSSAVEAQPHLRWHPLRGEWVIYAAHRQNRTFFPPPEYNPLLPMDSETIPTELPAGNYDIAVFENLFPSLTEKAQVAPDLWVPTQPAQGACEVVVYSQDPTLSLSRLELTHLELLIEVWTERTRELGGRPDIQYVMPFENKGREVGVTLHHPHGQIYAYPFVPPIPARELLQSQIHLEKTGRGLLESVIERELKDERRILYRGPHFVAFVPVCARYPYEVWVAPRARRASLIELTDGEQSDFARALKTVTLKYEGLWKSSFPYLMIFHQAPTDQQPHPEAHFRVEFYPPYRSPDRLKFLAGTELGAGTYANDSLPEEKALELQRVSVTL